MWSNDERNDLIHYGIPGMSWGVRNGPPYPLNAEGRRSFREHLNQGRVERRAKKLEKQVTKAAQKAQKKLEKKEAEDNIKLEKKVRKALTGKISIDKLNTQEMAAYVEHMKKRVEIMELTLKSDQKMKDIKENDKSLGRKIVEAQMQDIGNKVVKPLVTGAVGLAIYSAINAANNSKIDDEKKQNEITGEKFMQMLFQYTKPKK